MLEWALYYANLGWPVLPLHTWTGTNCTCGRPDCTSAAKHPRTRNGLKDADTDPDTIRAWWKRWPDANIGLRTGDAFDVLDIDGEEGYTSIHQAEQNYGTLPPGPTTLTGGGGMHRLYQPTGLGNRAGILEKVDWRGRNGYIVAPPSLHASGNIYTWTESANTETPLQTVEGWLHELLFPPPTPRPPVTAETGQDRADRYVRRAIDAEITELLRAAQGTRNDTLNSAAFNLYQFVAAGEIGDNEITQLLTRAAAGIGLADTEIVGTLKSAREGASQHPRTVPQLHVVEGNTARKIAVNSRPIEEHADSEPDQTPEQSVSRHDLELYEFLDQPEEDYQWVIPGIAEQGDRIIVTGPEGGGKSTFLRQTAVMVGAGIHPFTLEAIPARRALIIDLENGRRHLRRQLRPLAEAAGDRLAADMVRVISLPSGIDLLEGTHVEWLERRFEIDRPEIVVIGPIYKMANGDPNSEEVAKRVAYVIDRLRTEHECCFLIEAHQPYASNGGSRPERPYGASLWSRWPEFGLHISISGQVRHWRGARDERDWPKQLDKNGETWPWEVGETIEIEEEKPYDGPSHCRAAVAWFLAQHPAEEFSVNQLHQRLRADGKSYRRDTVGQAAEQLATAGTVAVRTGPRRSRLFTHRPVENLPTP